MRTRPYLLLGDSDRGALHARVAAALAAWREAWLPPGAPAGELVPLARPAAGAWLAPDAGGEPLACLGCTSDWSAAAGLLLAGRPAAAAAPASGLAAQVGEALFRSLLDEVQRAFGAAPASRWVAASPPADWLEPGAGAALFRCQMQPGCALELALSPGLVAGALPARPPAARAPATARARAVDPCTVELEALVGEAELELGEFSLLAAGDVIVLDRRIEEDLLLRIEGGEPVGRIHLGAAEGKRAVQVIGRARG